MNLELHRRIREQVPGNYFLYDLDRLERHLASLRNSGLGLWYACKANPLSAVLKTVAASGFRFDVASPGELGQVLSVGVPGRDILLTGPSKPKAFLAQALDRGVRTFVLESRNQWQELHELAEQRKISVDVLLRLQLDWQGASEKSVLGGNKTTAFGLEPEAWSRLPRSEYLRTKGAHVFQWGNILDEEKLIACWNSIARRARDFFSREGYALEILDLGGGLGISYDGTEAMVSWEKLRPELARIQSEFRLEQIWLELGRFAVGPFGTYVTTVNDRKSVRGSELLVLDGGINHLVRPALIQESFPALPLRESKSALRAFQVHGPLCTSLDCLGSFEFPEDIRVGDPIAFSQVGAYGFTESMPYFLCHELPAEVILKNGELTVLRKNESAAQWLR